MSNLKVIFHVKSVRKAMRQEGNLGTTRDVSMVSLQTVKFVEKHLKATDKDKNT